MGDIFPLFFWCSLAGVVLSGKYSSGQIIEAFLEGEGEDWVNCLHVKFPQVWFL
jgi:hypothetical protein